MARIGEGALAAAALGVSLICAGCGEAPVTSVAPRSPPMVPAAAMRAPEARAGSSLEVRVDAAIDSRITRPGSPFSVTVVEPLRSADGVIIVPRGAHVVGTVAGTGALEAPHLSLRFDRVVVGGHSAPIAVRVASAEVDRYQAFTEPPGWVGYEEWSGAIPNNEQRYAMPYEPPGPPQLILREGARMRLELVMPLASLYAPSSAPPAR